MIAFLRVSPPDTPHSQKGVSDMAHEASKKQPSNVVTNPIPEEEIRRRAYALYEERGRQDGNDLDGRLRAEAALKATPLKAAT